MSKRIQMFNDEISATTYLSSIERDSSSVQYLVLRIKDLSSLILKMMFFLIFVYLFTAQTLSAKPAQSREIKITGKYLSVPVAKPKQYKGWGNLIEIEVEGLKVHSFTLGMTSKLEDIWLWGSLDMSEYVGKTAIIRNVTGHPDNMAALPLFETSDKIKTFIPLYSEKGRPQFHLSQKIGWNNDPNGMVYADGLYHVSWQSNPVGLNWGNMYWGHAVSKDLVHWEERPHMIRIGAKDLKGKPVDKVHPSMVIGQAFSGGACVDHNNTLGKQVDSTKTIIAMITDTKGGDPTKDEGGAGQLVGESLAYSTDSGLTYSLLKEANPLISHHGRDPKPFWYEPGQHWCLVTYRQCKNPKLGKMAFYISKDLKNWTFTSFSDQVFHECPEFVELPVDGNPHNKKWILFDATPSYQIGSFDGKKFTSEFTGVRRGIGGNLKAAQCFSNAPNGRAIMMVWARFKPADPKAPFNQGFTLPLEISLRTSKDGVRSYANPVDELKVLRDKKILTIEDKALLLGENTLTFDKSAKLIELEMTLDYPLGRKPSAIYLQVGQNKIHCDLTNNKFHGAKGRYAALSSHDKEDGKLDLRIFIDSATLETFAENGAVYFIHNRNDQGAALNDIKIHVEDGEMGVESLNVYELKSISDR